jgi:hypothetical protein
LTVDPTWSNRQFFETRLLTHRKVKGFERDGDVYVIERDTQPPVRVFLTNSYVVGLAEHYEVCGKASDLDAIVTISPYNSVSGDAWRQGQTMVSASSTCRRRASSARASAIGSAVGSGSCKRNKPLSRLGVLR